MVVFGLILGALRRTGPLVWTLPYSANTTFRQLGLAILLGGIGINSGKTFIETIGQGDGVSILVASVIISFVSAAITFIVGYKIVKLRVDLLRVRIHQGVSAQAPENNTINSRRSVSQQIPGFRQLCIRSLSNSQVLILSCPALLFRVSPSSATGSGTPASHTLRDCHIAVRHPE